MKSLFADFDHATKMKALRSLISDSTPDADFFFMIILSVLMATFGLLIDNIPVLIASMLIAPLLSPVLSMALGIVTADKKLIFRSFYAIAKSFVIAVAISALVTLFFLPFVNEGLPYFGQNFEVYIIYFAIAVISGIAASYSLVSPHFNSTLPAAAIAVTLIPPIAATGVGIAKFNWTIISSSILIFILNIIGIIFASLVMFSLMHFYIKRYEVNQIIEEEDGKNTTK